MPALTSQPLTPLQLHVREGHSALDHMHATREGGNTVDISFAVVTSL